MSMRTFWSTLCAAGLLLTATACEKAEEPAEETAEEMAEEEEEAEEEMAEAEEEAPAEPSAPSAETLPIPEDFAEQVESEVTEDNYEEQLAAMEKELTE